MKRFLHSCAHYVLGLSLFLCITAQAVPPSNDNFANAAELSFEFLTSVNNVDGTYEPGEPPHSRFGRLTIHSAWYYFTPTFNGQIELDSTGSNVNTVIAVYKGKTLNKLTLVEKGDDNLDGGTRAIIRFAVTKGVKYYIALDGWTVGGSLKLVMRRLMQYQAAVFESPLRFTDKMTGGSVEDNGKLTLTMTDKGTVSGKVMLSGKSYAFKSAILIDKTIPIMVVRSDRLPVFVTVTLETSFTGEIQLAAEVSGIMGDKTATATAYQAPKFNNLTPCPRIGNYNYRINTQTNTGYSFCRLSISKTGICKGSGVMGDGTSFTYSAPLLNNDDNNILLDLGDNGTLCHHTPLYGGKGQVTATVILTRIDENNTQVTGNAGWFRPYNAASLFIPLGLEEQNMALVGKNYIRPAANTRLDTAFNADNGVAEFSGYSSGSTDVTETLTLGTNNVFTVNDGDNLNAVTLKVDIKTGLLSGSIKFNEQAKASKLRALLIPTGNPSITPGFYGYNLTPERGGEIEIVPD